MFTGISNNDIAAGVSLSFLSFLASVVQGSTSLGDGVFLQITWGIWQALVPYATTESSLGSDGLRVVTMFMYVRMCVIPPFMLWRLYSTNKLKNSSPTATEDVNAPKSLDTIHDSTGSPSSPPTPPSPTSTQSNFSLRFFLLLVIPNIIWSFLGVLILHRVDSGDIAGKMGIICISFSFAYMALKMWKASPAKKSMPQWIQTLFSPRFLVKGTTTNQITTHAQIVCFIAFNLSGLMVTLAGIGAPAMMIVILLYEIPMKMQRFTSPFATICSAYVRMAFALHTGVFSLERWPFYLPAILIGLFGTEVGVRIGNVLTPSMYSATIFCLLINAGTVMLTHDPYITVTALLAAFVGLSLKQFWWDKKVQTDGKENEKEVKAANAGVTVENGKEEFIGIEIDNSHSDVNNMTSASQLQCSGEDLNRISRYCEAEAMQAVMGM